MHTSRAKLRFRYSAALPWPIGTIAMAINNNGEFEKALEPARECLAMYQSFEAYGMNWKIVPYPAVGHLGWCLWSLRKFAEAEKALQEAVDADARECKAPSYGYDADSFFSFFSSFFFNCYELFFSANLPLLQTCHTVASPRQRPDVSGQARCGSPHA